MKVFQGKRLFFLLPACILVATSLFLLKVGPESTGSPTGYQPDEKEVAIEPAESIKPEPTTDDHIILHPSTPEPGDFLVIEAGPLKSTATPEIEFDFPGEISSVHHTGNLLYAVIGICYETELDRYKITISKSANPSESLELQKAVSIGEKKFQKSRFSMPTGVTEGWTPDRLAEEREMIREAMAKTEPHPLWIKRFIEPLEGRVTSEFGAIRIIDGNPPRRHDGIDIAAEEGTPVVSPNRGIVRLAESLLAGGKTVIIDYGMDLSSTYMHLDSIEAEKGQIIERGEVLGTVGMTGYATGPHLHWEVNVGQTPVNPEQIFDNDLLWIPCGYAVKKLSTGHQ